MARKRKSHGYGANGDSGMELLSDTPSPIATGLHERRARDTGIPGSGTSMSVPTPGSGGMTAGGPMMGPQNTMGGVPSVFPKLRQGMQQAPTPSFAMGGGNGNNAAPSAAGSVASAAAGVASAMPTSARTSRRTGVASPTSNSVAGMANRAHKLTSRQGSPSPTPNPMFITPIPNSAGFPANRTMGPKLGPKTIPGVPPVGHAVHPQVNLPGGARSEGFAGHGFGESITPMGGPVQGGGTPGKSPKARDRVESHLDSIMHIPGNAMEQMRGTHGMADRVPADSVGIEGNRHGFGMSNIRY